MFNSIRLLFLGSLSFFNLGYSHSSENIAADLVRSYDNYNYCQWPSNEVRIAVVSVEKSPSNQILIKRGLFHPGSPPRISNPSFFYVNETDWKINYKIINESGFELVPQRTINMSPISKVEVDSFFNGYSKSFVTLNDALVNLDVFQKTPVASQLAWASAETTNEHWVNFRLHTNCYLEKINIYWAIDNNEVFKSKEVKIFLDGKECETKLLDEKKDRESRGAFPDKPVREVRLVQPPGKGSEKRPNLMWLREVEIWGSATPLTNGSRDQRVK